MVKTATFFDITFGTYSKEEYMHQQELSKIPRQLRDHWEGRTGQVTVMGMIREYLIISHDLYPSPKYFASCRPDREVPPFISDDVPPEFRPYVMTHEIYEGYHLRDQPHRCLRALEFELGSVPATRIRPYLRFRLTMFEALLAFMKDPEHGPGYPPDAVSLATEAQSHLKRLLR